MPHQPLRPRRATSRFHRWLPANPSGVPRRQAFLRVLIGVGLGIGGGVMLRTLNAHASTSLSGIAELHLVLGSSSGAIVGPLGGMLVARLLDRTIRADDQLIGYSGLIRMLLHAGELSLLGALAGGVGAGAEGVGTGLVYGALITGLGGAGLYHLRGLGLILGLTVGTVIGAISGAVGGSIPSLGT